MPSVALSKLTDDAMHPAQRRAVLPDGQGGVAIQAVGRGEIVGAAGKLDVQLERRRERFAVGKAHHRGLLGAGQGQGEMHAGALDHGAAPWSL